MAINISELPTTMPGFTTEQTRSLQNMITASANQALALASLATRASADSISLASLRGSTPAPIAQDAAAPSIRRSSRIQRPSPSEDVKATTEELEAEMPAVADRAQHAAAPATRRSSRLHGPSPSEDVKATTEAEVETPPVANRAQQQNAISSVPTKRKADTLDKTPAPPAKKTRSRGRKQSSKPAPVRPIPETQILGDLYSNNCASLPAAGALRHAHCIDVEKYMAREKQPEIKMGDFVATILYKYSPEVLKAFLDVNSHPKFSFTRTEKAGTGNMDLSIQRFNSTVHCGYLNAKPAADSGDTESPHNNTDDEKTSTLGDSCGYLNAKSAADSGDTESSHNNADDEKSSTLGDSDGHPTAVDAESKWDNRFTYEMEPGGRWVPTLWVGNSIQKEDKKKKIDPLACEFGHAAFTQQKWAHEEGVKIEVSTS